jgi:dihydrofolate reductase
VQRPRTSTFVGVSLDGFLARPDGTLDWLDPFAGEEHGYTEFIASVDSIVIGRATHDFVMGMLQTGVAWPYEGKRCVVMTHRPLDAKHGERAFSGGPAEVLALLQADGAKHAYVDGGVVIRSFLAAGLLDRLTVSIVPQLIGTGKPLFGGVQLESGLTLEGVSSYKNGLAQLRYVAKRPT